MTGVPKSVLTLWGDDSYAVGCRVIGDSTATGGITHTTANARVESCWISGISTDSGTIGSTSSTGTAYIVNNRVEGCLNAYELGHLSNCTTVYFINNTESNSGSWATRIYSLPSVAFYRGYNTMETQMDTDYGGPQTGDAFATTPEYTGSLPTMYGNLDRNGYDDVVLISELDINGNSRRTDDVLCRGPAQTQIFYATGGLKAVGRSFNNSENILPPELRPNTESGVRLIQKSKYGIQPRIKFQVDLNPPVGASPNPYGTSFDMSNITSAFLADIEGGLIKVTHGEYLIFYGQEAYFMQQRYTTGSNPTLRVVD